MNARRRVRPERSGDDHPAAEGGYGLDAQWDDDVHHALHAILTGERQGYYVDFGSLATLAKVYTRRSCTTAPTRPSAARCTGAPIDRERTPGSRFVGYLQDHDQVGNRALGDRLPEITVAAPAATSAPSCCSSRRSPPCSGWARSGPRRTRWPFFTSHPEPQLAAAEGRGRIEEFATFGWDAGEMLDPQDPLAFQTAKLNWFELAAAPHRNVLALYRRLIQLRRAEPDLHDVRLSEVTVDYDEAARWLVLHRGRAAHRGQLRRGSAGRARPDRCGRSRHRPRGGR